MRIWNRLTLGISIAACLANSAPGAEPRDPRIGSWVEKKVSASYQGLRRSFEDLGAGLVRLNITVDASGTARSRSDHRCDGHQYPVLGQSGEPTDLTFSCRYRDALTVDFAFTRIGVGPWSVSRGTERFTEDGKTYAISATLTDANGKVVEQVERLFERQHS